MGVGFFFFGINPFDGWSEASVLTTEVSADYAFTQQLKGRSWEKDIMSEHNFFP